jgi:hypothetical protein
VERAAKIAVVFVVALLGLYFGSQVWAELQAQRVREREHEEKQLKLRQARDLISRATNCPDKDFPDVAAEADPWGNDLVVRRNKGVVNSVVVVCLGPDGAADTTDDISGFRSLKMDWTEAGAHMGEAGGDLGKGFLRGLKKSLLDKKPKDPAD